MTGTICHALKHAIDRWPKAKALGYKEQGKWHWLTWEDYYQRIEQLAVSLCSLGLNPGDHVAILGNNRVEWLVANMAVIVAGGVPAGIYVSSSSEQCEFILQHCKARILFVENPAQLAKVASQWHRLPELKKIILMDGDHPEENILSWCQVSKAKARP